VKERKKRKPIRRQRKNNENSGESKNENKTVLSLPLPSLRPAIASVSFFLFPAKHRFLFFRAGWSLVYVKLDNTL